MNTILMSYHVFQKETVNLCFPQKEKNQKNQIKIKIKITKIGNNVIALHNFHDSKPFALLAFQDEGRMHPHPKNHGHLRP